MVGLMKLHAILGYYLFTERALLRDDVPDMLHAKENLLNRKPNSGWITAKMLSFVENFMSGMGARL